jgi:hypothetical protein
VSESTTIEHFSSYASLAAIGTLVRERNLFGPVRELLKVEQKTVKHSPVDKLYDAFIAILAGALGLVEINTRLRAEPALQRAFGREACAEQSVVQDTLDACTAENVAQFQTALAAIYRSHSQGYTHDYRTRHQLLDVDMSGLPCGKQAAFGSKGYFAKQRNRRGRQLGRVLATHYQEVVVDQVFDGKTQLTTALQPLVSAAVAVLELDAARRARTIVRVDAGGGSLNDVNWLLEQGFVVLAKDYSSQRSAKLAQSVTLLGTLAHNVLLWTRHWLAASEPKLARYGLKRLVRDIFHINGRVVCDALGHVVAIFLNPAAPLVRGLVAALQALLTPLHIAVRLGES